MTPRPLIFCAVLLASGATPAHARDYVVERFESRAEAVRGGTLRVTETMLVRFPGGAFKEFRRDVPSRLTDGVEIVSASLDGSPLPSGRGPGQVDIGTSSRIRVTWHLAPTSNSSHLFALTYVLRGVVRQEEDADVVAVRMLPREHEYGIETADAVLELPVEPLDRPNLRFERIGSSTVTIAGRRVNVAANAIAQDGWIEAVVRLPRGSLVDAAPAWQQHEERVQGHAAGWIIAAFTSLTSGFVLLFAVRQRYDPPSVDVTSAAAGTALPDTLQPAVAAALVANGSPRMEHFNGALLWMASKGDLTIEEQARSLGRRNFVVSRRASRRALAAHEQAAIDIMFTGRHDAEDTVRMGRARRRITRRFRKFREALRRDMAGLGLIDEDRESVRRQFTRIGVGAMAAAAAGVTIVLSSLVDDFGGWPMLIPAALAIVGAASFICAAAHTPLSNDALRRAHVWRGFQKALRANARERDASPAEGTVRDWLPFIVALGGSDAWAGYLDRHRAVAPEWFRALAGTDTGPAFASFVASTAAGRTDHGGS